MKKTLYPRYCPNLLCQPEANLKYARSISVIVVRYCEDALKGGK